MVVTTMTYWNITISLVELTDLVKSVQYRWTFNQLIELQQLVVLSSLPCWGMVVTTMTYWNITISLVELTDLVKSVQYRWTFNQLIGPQQLTTGAPVANQFK